MNNDITFTPNEVLAPAVKKQERVTSFSPLAAGWYNHYIVEGQDLYRACPGVLEVRTYNIASGRNEILSVVYVSAVFDDGELIGADELIGYRSTIYKPQGDKA